MTMPPPPTAGYQTSVGLNPNNASEINQQVGYLLRQYQEIVARVKHFNVSLQSLTLTAAPYNMTPEDDSLIKSAIGGLDTSLQAVDMTFINRLTGLW